MWLIHVTECNVFVCSGMLLNTKILVCTGDVSFEIYAVNVSTLCLKSDLSQECIIFTNNDNNITTITLATAIIIIIIITIIIIIILKEMI